jgi:hypothetical protein
MTKIFLASAALMLLTIGSQAFAQDGLTRGADVSKAQATAEFRVKVAACKASSGKANSSDFYRKMADCVDKVVVTTTVASAK